MVTTYNNFMGGKWIRSSSKNTFNSTNPSNPKQILGRFQDSNENDLNAAVRAAKKALPAWSQTPAPKRGLILLEVARLLRKDKQRLGKLVSTEMGKVLPEALGDVQEAIDVFEYMAGEGRRLWGRTTPSELKSKFCMTTRMPLGVVGLITPWNFPIAIPGWKLAPALICGNTVVFKPSSDTPLCALELVKILDKAGVPKGVINFVTGSGKNVGTPLVKHPEVRGISFTGSKDTGDFILKNAGIKKVGLELGGKNAIIVMEDAKLDLALEGVLWGAFGTTGQRCTATSRVIVHQKVKAKFEKMLVNRIKKLKLGASVKTTTDIGPLVNAAAVDKSEDYCSIGKKEGAKLLTGGTRGAKKGHFFKPTLFTNVKPNMRIATEEIFGPVLSLISVKNLKEAIEVANNIDYGLSSAIYTNDIENAFRAIENLDAGITYINSSTIGAEVHLPFGGTKHTGNGTREAGWTGIEEFSEEKAVYIDYSGKLQKAQIDNS
jgi:alpha-ketoglutaric semialdehyde dehydrogenase